MTAVIGPGSTFGRYHIESMIGRGGMGLVYLATDESLDRPVALKLIAPELTQDEGFRRRFLKEPRLAASLDHPNVVPIYEAGEREGQLYLAMRYVQGTDLRKLLERERTLAPERVLAILGQVAGALDAAHRRGLVHRDVKPANVLLDEDEHAYLTDFGITKQAGGASTDTGQAAGTLDYVAPEQIRGEPVDGRSDGYALACVLYECLTGTPPFRRATQAETLWAHLQEPPPSVPRAPALDRVLRTALAKEIDERYATCAELMDAGREALGIVAPPQMRRTSPGRGWRRRRALLAAGLIVLAGTAAAAGAVVGSGGEGRDLGIVGNGVAVLDGADGHVGSFIASATAPSNIAVGEGAVWVLNTEEKTISRIDPETKAVTGHLRTQGVPTDIAAGDGAVWVGNGGGNGGNFTVSISRIDPRTQRITRTVKLPDRTAGSFLVPVLNWGFANIAVGAGAVWARNPDHTVSRIDPGTGRRIATIHVNADKLAAGIEGVWIVNGDAVTQIDPRTNRPGQTIRIGTASTAAIAVGAGSVWVTADQQGVVWRIEPGEHAEARSIDVGAGVTYIAFGAGAVWAANYIDGTVSRIDPGTNAVTKIPIGAAQSLAAGPEAAWVSTAGGTSKGELPDEVCGDAAPSSAKPDVMIASDLPLQGLGGAGRRAMADAIRYVLRRHGYRAGKFAVGYRSCDDSTAQTGDMEARRCAANANAYAHAHAPRLVAVIGPYNSSCASIAIPILNRAPGGPLAMISPTNTGPGLTRAGVDDGGYRGEPDVYYPTGVRNFVRLRPGDDLQGAAHAVLAKRLGLDGVFVVDDGTDPLWKGFVSDPFRSAAEKLGVRIAGSAGYDPKAEGYAALADRIARSGAQGVVIGGDPYNGGDRVVKAIRARLGDRVTIMGSFLFAFAPDVLERVGRGARGMYATSLDVPLTAVPMTASGRAFARDVGALSSPAAGVLEAGQAAELVVAAIARSDGTRASVLRELRASDVKDGIIGSFRFDANGDMTTASIPILRITGATPPGAGLPPEFEGARVDRVVKVPPGLVR